MMRVLLLVFISLWVLHGQSKEDIPVLTADQFEAMEKGVDWKVQFKDDGSKDWQELYFLDGKKASIVRDDKGMLFSAGPDWRDDASHAVLWTHASFAGDVKIEFEFTKMDDAFRAVNILYIQATGKGEAPQVADIYAWRELREVPSMSQYFNNMHTLHISYAAFGNKDNEPKEDDYIRARRYLGSVDKGLGGTDLQPDIYMRNGIFRQHAPVQVTVIKTDEWLTARFVGEEKTVLCSWPLEGIKPVTEGRIGFRQMFTRISRYRNIAISTR